MATTTENGGKASAPKSASARQSKPTSGKSAGGFGQGAVIGAAAAGLLAGLAAAFGRKVATQASTAMSGDWLDALKSEHKATLALFDKIEATTNEQTTKRSVMLTQLKHALAKHAFEEENVIYPALRDHQEKDEADHLNHDHGYVKQYLYDLAHMPRNSSAWLDKVREFRTALETHIREEEDTIFPALHTKLDKADNGSLTTEMHLAGFKLA